MEIQKKYQNVTVLMGGDSEERDISLVSGKAVAAALEERGYNVSSCILNSSDEENVKKDILKYQPEAVFIALHGGAGEDGSIQQVLEKIQIPYTGSGPEASYNAMNKIKSHEIFQENGIRIADYIVIDNPDNDLIKTFETFPCVVKPVAQGSSVGLSIINSAEKLKDAVNEAFKHGFQVIIAEYIAGREVTVGILDNKPLAVLEIIPKRDFYDFQAKYNDEQTQYIVPAKIDENVSQAIQAISEKAHRVLNCNYFSRVDLRLSTNNEPFVLEVNTIPGLTSHSLLPKAAAAAGYSFYDLCEKILNSAGIMK
jgi:D-alanine-D-alanine ligase